MPCRILYRSRQRGYLELDLLLGKWAEENIAHLDQNRLKDLVDLLEEVRTSLFYVVTEIKLSCLWWLLLEALSCTHEVFD